MLVYGLLAISFLIVGLSQIFVQYAYRKYSKVETKNGVSGAEVARDLLKKNGLNDVYVVEIDGFLTDHYDPTRKVVRLSKTNYRGTSVSAVSVASHECGHALQDKDGYLFMRIRHMMVPITNLASFFGYIVLMIGVVATLTDLIWLGIALEIIVLLFQIVTLPVEVNASKRALNIIKKENYLVDKEFKEGKYVLIAAALTYVASVASNLLEVIRLVLIFTRRD